MCVLFIAERLPTRCAGDSASTRLDAAIDAFLKTRVETNPWAGGIRRRFACLFQADCYRSASISLRKASNPVLGFHPSSALARDASAAMAAGSDGRMSVRSTTTASREVPRK